MNRAIINGRLLNKRQIATMFFEDPKYNINGLKLWAMFENHQIVLCREDFRKIYYK